MRSKWVKMNKVSIKQICFKISLLIGLLVVLAPAVASASSQSFYSLDNTAKGGMLVTLTSNSKVVTPAVSQNAKSLVGVVAGSDDASLDQQPGQISVSTDGVSNALVSTLNGDISVGDRITASSIAGVGSKLTGSGWIVGTAQAAVNSHTPGAAQTNAKNSQGVNTTVYVASIPVIIKVVYYTAAGNSSDQAKWIPQTLQAIANDVAGKSVSTIAVVLSSIVLIVGVLLAGFIINSAVRGGMLAISRQPLAKSIITRQIIRSFALALFILGVMLAGAWIILRLV